MNDTRFKVNELVIMKMRQLRKAGKTYAQIAEEVGGISWATAYYWTNDKARKKQRERNAQRRHTKEENKVRIVRDMETRKKRWQSDPKARLAHEIRAALTDKRCKRKTVRGIPIEEAKRLLESGELNAPTRKIDG